MEDRRSRSSSRSSLDRGRQSSSETSNGESQETSRGRIERMRRNNTRHTGGLASLNAMRELVGIWNNASTEERDQIAQGASMTSADAYGYMIEGLRNHINPTAYGSESLDNSDGSASLDRLTSSDRSTSSDSSGSDDNYPPDVPVGQSTRNESSSDDEPWKVDLDAWLTSENAAWDQQRHDAVVHFHRGEIQHWDNLGNIQARTDYAATMAQTYERYAADIEVGRGILEQERRRNQGHDGFGGPDGGDDGPPPNLPVGPSTQPDFGRIIRLVEENPPTQAHSTRSSEAEESDSNDHTPYDMPEGYVSVSLTLEPDSQRNTGANVVEVESIQQPRAMNLRQRS